jgi:hypothetical protein
MEVIRRGSVGTGLEVVGKLRRSVKKVKFGYHAPQDPEPALSFWSHAVRNVRRNFCLCTTSNCIKTAYVALE